MQWNKCQVSWTNTVAWIHLVNQRRRIEQPLTTESWKKRDVLLAYWRVSCPPSLCLFFFVFSLSLLMVLFPCFIYCLPQLIWLIHPVAVEPCLNVPVHGTTICGKTAPHSIMVANISMAWSSSCSSSPESLSNRGPPSSSSTHEQDPRWFDGCHDLRGPPTMSCSTPIA